MLTVFDTKRHTRAPAVPTITEVLPAYTPGRAWIGFLAPPNLPAPVAARLNSEIVRILKSPDVVEILGQSGLEVIANAQSDFAAMIVQDARIWDEAAVMADLVPAGALSAP
jgi:tripartite-type tricarboxylate transporter receptor subunit TctC